MPLYKQNNAAELAQSAMSGATQAMAAQTKETGTRTEKESNFWDDLNKGAAAVAYVGRGLDGLTKAADGAWNMYDKYKLRDAYDSVDKAWRSSSLVLARPMLSISVASCFSAPYSQRLTSLATGRPSSAIMR